jgi:hypothetical protein
MDSDLDMNASTAQSVLGGSHSSPDKSAMRTSDLQASFALRYIHSLCSSIFCPSNALDVSAVENVSGFQIMAALQVLGLSASTSSRSDADDDMLQAATIVPTQPPRDDSWASTASNCSNAFFASYSSCSSLLDRPARCVASLCSVPQGPSDWLPPQKARSPLTACGFRGRPSSAREACDHSAHSGEARPAGPARTASLNSSPYRRTFSSTTLSVPLTPRISG